ncbi:SH3 domain-containing protein Dlish-like [Acanthaster planci]|uniref:SH3 domain-containing protein Dlish-like n=1 Tax=Acanthaster planci TaxID=133434 RepID=A0A8B7YB65_ACAPL|nr:SH3 domain-containing protein Dlish-like [Acanthaster planci]
MSFLCGPMRLRIKKRRDDVESLLHGNDSLSAAKIPNDPASRMIVLHDFIGCLKDELSVSEGQSVDILDVDRKWAYVAASSGRGFVPLSCLGPSTRRHSTDSIVNNEQSGQGDTLLSNRFYQTGGETVFAKSPRGQYVVLYDFKAQDENDLSVVSGDCVLSLNEDDPEWTWVQKTDGAEGFVPTAYLYSDTIPVVDSTVSSLQNSLSSTEPHLHKLQLCGTELMSLYDYQGRIADDLTVVRGDLLYADMTNQTHDEWLWAYCPRTQTCGFIPRGYARPPAIE